jgi:hypothetical protein
MFKGDQIKEDETKALLHMGVMRLAYKISVGQPKGKRELAKSYLWKDNFKMVFMDGVVHS